jgi:hypothetical protein
MRSRNGLMAASVIALALWMSATWAEDAPGTVTTDPSVAFTTDKAQVVNCQYVGRVDSTAGAFTVGIGLKSMLTHNAQKIGADTVLHRGRFDLQGEGFKCRK